MTTRPGRNTSRPSRSGAIGLSATSRSSGDDEVLSRSDGLPAARKSRVTRSLAIAAAVIALVLVGGIRFGLSRRADGESTSPSLPAPVHQQVTFTGREGAPTVSPDGRRLAYVSDRTPEKKLIVQELAGGPPIEIFSAPEINYLRWSPDGKELLLWARGGGWNGIYVVPQLGGRPRLIATGMMCLSCWSPDGSTIAVAGALDNKIRFFDQRGTEQRSLTLEGDHWSIWDLDWSAAGDKLLFVSSDRQGRYEIGTIRADGSGQQTILSSATEIPSTRWVPHANAIYYLQRINQTMSLFRIPADAATEASAISGSAVLTGLETDRFFAFSGDARRLVYARAPYHSNLRMLDLTTGRTTELTQGTSLIERPRVSPDGVSVVFNVGHDPHTNLYTLPIAGGTPRQLTFFDALTVAGAWSADGQRIAFASTQGGRARVWTMAAATGVADASPVGWRGERQPRRHVGTRTAHPVSARRQSELLRARSRLGVRGVPGAGRGAGVDVRPRSTRPKRTGSQRCGIGLRREASGSSTEAITPRGCSIAPLPDQSDRSAGPGMASGSMSPKARSGRSEARRPSSATMMDVKILRLASNGGGAETVAPFRRRNRQRDHDAGRASRHCRSRFSSRSDVWIVDDFDVQRHANR